MSINAPIRILFVEDDLNLGFLLKENYESKGFVVDWAKNGQEGIEAFTNKQYDICILDIMMPLKDGFTTAREIRRKDAHIPLVFLTAKQQDEDKIKGFELGADDYVTKPFSAHELMFRIKAILKRCQPDKKNGNRIYNLGKLVFDYDNRTLSDGQDWKKLSTKETELLKLFAVNPNFLLNRSVILKSIWGNDDYFTSKTMDVYLTRLRKLLRTDPDLELQNYHGVGYKLIIHREAVN